MLFRSNFEKAKVLNSKWNLSFFSNQLRTFLFKFYNNLLGYNYVVQHFANVDENCTICSAAGLNDLSLETPLHLFYQCTIVETLINDFYGGFLRINLTRDDLFLGFNTDDLKKDKILNIVNCLFLKYIWDTKLRYSVPNIVSLKNYIKSELSVMSSVNKKTKELLSNFLQNF